MPYITAAQMRRILDAAVATAEEQGVGVAVTVVDRGGNLHGLVRMDGASFLATTMSVAKARTAAGFGAPTTAMADFASGNPTVLAALTTQPDVALLPGGVPILVDGEVAGAVGVAGHPAGGDHPIAEAGAAALASDAVVA